MTIYLFNRLIQQPDNKTLLLYYIAHDPLFQGRVNRFWSLFPKTTEGQISKTNFNDVFTNVYTFLQPEFSFSEHRQFAQQKTAKFIINGQYIYKTFLQIFLEISSQIIQNIDLRSALGLMDLLWQRTINASVVDINGGVEEIPLQVNLLLYHRTQIQQHCVLSRNLKILPLNPIYYEERMKYIEDPDMNTALKGIIYSLKSQEHIIPLGYICQSVISTLVNNNCRFQEQYDLVPQQRIKLTGIKIKAMYEDKALQPIKDCLINREIMTLISALKMGLPMFQMRQYSENIECYRLSEYFGRQCYFQQLKTNDEHQILCNVLSSFHDRSQFNINEIQNVRDKWNKKKKVTLLSDQKKIPSKQPLNVEEEARLCEMKIAKKNQPHFKAQKLENQVNFLKEKLKLIFEEGKNINLSEYLTSHQVLPFENQDPFTQDILEYCKMTPLQILINGRPKCGKSVIARQIAKKYDLIYVSVDSVVNKLFERVKYFQENPPDVDDDGNPKESLSLMQKFLISELQQGKSPKQEDIIDLVNYQMKSQAVSNQGFILDLPLNSYDWLSKILNNQIHTPKIRCRYFSHVIQLQQTDEEWKWFVSGLKQDPETQTITSSFERYIITKPKPEPVQGESEQEQDVDQEKPPLKQQSLVPLQVQQSKMYNIDLITKHLHPRNHLKVRIAGKNNHQIIQILSLSLYRIPLAKKLQGSDKQLLTIGLEEQKLFRKWSAWGIADPVQLLNGKLTNGKSQFAAEYAGRVFLFDNELNQQLFLKCPTRYLKEMPALPKKFNIVINGPFKSGKKTLASKLSEIYGFKVVNISEIIASVLSSQKDFTQFIPSNFDPRSNSIHLSEGEWKQFSKGNPLNPKDVIPIVLHQLGIKLQKKPQDWGIERTQEELEQLEKEREEKEREQLAKRNTKKSKKKEAKQPKQEENKAPPLQDLALGNIIPEVNYLGKLDQIKGYIFVGYPTTEEQLNAFKFFNIPIDKYILLTDSNQQTPNKVLKQRLTDAQLQQVSNFNTLVAAVKDALGQQVVKEINIDDSIQNLIVKIQNFVDPFITKVDEDNLNRVSADKQEDDDPIYYGPCGEYCPVILEEGWLLKGKDQFECGVRGKRFKCFDEKELNLFKENPTRYLTKNYEKVPPRVMMMGIRGVGLKTQLMKVNQQTKIPILNLKDNMLAHLQNQKVKRRTDRYYMKGFRIPEGEEQNPDADLEEEAAEFDKKQHQIQTIKNIFSGIQEILINGNFYDVSEEVVQTPLVDLLMQAHRLPEMVMMLKVDEKRWMQRVFNPKQVQLQHQKLVQQAREQKQKQINQARQKAQQEGQQFQEPEEIQDLGVATLEDMLNDRKQKLKEQRTSDLAQMEQYMQKFREYGVQVIEIDCQRDIHHVFDKIMYNMKPYLNNRVEKWETFEMLKIESERINDFLKNYIVKQSRFGKLNPLTLRKPLKPCPLIYRSRMYYLDNEEERDIVYQNPSILKKKSPIPKDVIITPIVYIIGKPKTGKSQLSKIISKKLGLVRISFRKLVEEFTQQHNDNTVQKIVKTLKTGGVVSDEQIVNLIQKRVQFKDCLQNGWVLDGFPHTKTQADLLIKKGFSPSVVFSLQLSTNQLKKRTFSDKNCKYSYDPEVFNERINQYEKQLITVENVFMNKYNNIRFLDAKVSKWGVFEEAKNHLHEAISGRQGASRSILCKQPVEIMHLGLPFNAILNNLSSFKNYCIVTFRSQREYVKCELIQLKFSTLFKGKIYMSSTAKQLNDFKNNPDLYIQQPKSFSPPEIIISHQILQKYDKVQNKGYCMVELSRGKLLKGTPFLSIQYKGKIFGIGKALSAKMFLKNPGLYEMSTLQDKLPVQFQKKNQLKKIAKKNDCTAFLEHHLGNILMRVLAQLGYRRLKYPTLSSKQTALKFLAISLKANNPNKDQQYRQKYKEKLQEFIKHCNYSQELRNEVERKQKVGDSWTSWDQENILKLCEEYYSFMNDLSSSDKNIYFSQFIN